MRDLRWLTGALLFGMSCSSGEATDAVREPGPAGASTGTGEDRRPDDVTPEAGRDLPPADDFGVRVAGGESGDFGNGTDTPCGLRSVDTVISEEEAQQEGLDVDADRAWLASAHAAALLYNPSECASAPEVCDDTRVELRAEVVEVIRVDGISTRPSESCPAEWQAFDYRLAVSIESDDGNLAGTFYARAGRTESDAGVITVRGKALPDLRNFEGQLPIKLEPARAHFAFMDAGFALMNDGTASGELEPAVSYYDELAERVAVAEPIGPEMRFGPDLTRDPEAVYPSALAREGTASTLSTYSGSSDEPRVTLTVRADAVEPMADVYLTITIDGEEVQAESVAAGTSVELGKHPFGTRVSVDVHNGNGAGQVRANVLQDNCFVASSFCNDQDCTTHVAYTAAHHLCLD